MLKEGKILVMLRKLYNCKILVYLGNVMKTGIKLHWNECGQFIKPKLSLRFLEE